MHENNGKSFEQFLKELRNHYQLVEEAIGYINACKQQVDDNANTARLSVRTEMNDLLDHLRQREIQLLRRIDIMHSHYGDALHVQNAKLHQILGTLKHVLHSFEGRQHDVIDDITPEDLQFVEDVKKQKLPLNSIGYQSNFEEINKFIERFGTLTCDPGYFIWHPSEELKSKCLPSKLEEYEDADHQLFYKTLQDLQLERVLELKKTSLSQTSSDGWLKAPLLSMAQKTSCGFVLPDNYVLEDVSFWLKEGLRESILKEEDLRHDDDDNKSFEMVSIASESDSIELLTNRTSFSSNETCSQSPPSMNMKNGCKDRRNCCVNDSSMDIENLGTALCSNGNFSCNDYVSKWLIKETSDNLGSLSKYQLQVSDVCVANECCADFGECVCKERCFSKAFEILDNQMSNLQADLSDWLRSPNYQRENWLKSTTRVDDEKIDCPEKKLQIISLNDTDNYKWFKSSASPHTVSNLSCQVNDDLNWLTNAESNSNHSFIRKDFATYFNNNDQTVWLAHSNV